MNSLSRLLPYVWPHRWKLALSIVLAFLVAFLWAANLSAVFPIVKTLLEGQTLGGYVTSEIEKAETHSKNLTAQAQQIEEQLRLKEQTGHDVGAQENVGLLKRKAKIDGDLSDTSRRLWLLSCVNTYLIPYVPKDQFDTLTIILSVLLVATLFKGLFIFLQDILVSSAVELTIIGVRDECFRRTLALDYQTLTSEGTAQLMSRITYDTNMMSGALAFLGGKVVREPLKAIACIAFAFYVKWQLTLLALFFIPLIGWALYKIGNRLRKASHRMMDSMSRIYKSLEETLNGLKVIIAFNGAQRHQERFHQENMGYYGKMLKAVKIRALSHPVTELMGLFAVFLTLLPGSYLVLRETRSIWGIRLTSEVMQFADLALLYVLLAGALDPLRKLSQVYNQLQQTVAASDRVFGFIDRESLVVETTAPKSLPRHSKAITFENVCFTYLQSREDGDQRSAALKDVNLTVEAGEVIAIVGANGSGKSTLVNLLPRFFDPDQGSVRIDDISIRDVRLNNLRSQIGVVTQETILFDGTIEENIRYGNPQATPDQLRAAAEKASVTPILDELPDGLLTRVGENGQSLSGGQRQRIALARAILLDPSILILDEATSAIDTESELLVHQALRQFAKGRTVFLITHTITPSLLDLVTRIVVMEDGQLIAAGSHETLIETCSLYQRLYHSQTLKRAG